MVESKTLRTVFFYVLAGVLVSIVTYLAISQYLSKKSPTPSPASEIPLPTSLPRKVDLTTETVVYKTTNETTITYWMYGKIVSWDSVAPDVIRAKFVFDKDPLKSRIPIKIMGEEGRYYLRMYWPKF
ncbi:MAG: hypothetical protein AAB276_03400, partial [Pseudomonadota bacterium]